MNQEHLWIKCTYSVVLRFVRGAAVGNRRLCALELSRQQLPKHERHIKPAYVSHQQSIVRGDKTKTAFVSSAHPAENKGFPGVTQSDQQHGASDGFTG